MVVLSFAPILDSAKDIRIQGQQPKYSKQIISLILTYVIRNTLFCDIFIYYHLFLKFF